MSSAVAGGSRERVVLLVDDDEDIREIVSEILTDQGHKVRVAHNGREALAALDDMADAPPQLILLDLMMPELDGNQFLAVLDEHPMHTGIPIVVVTASRRTAPQSVRHRVSGWLPKPVEYDHLVATVSRFLGTPAPPAPAPVTELRPRGQKRDVAKFMQRRVDELHTLRAALASSDHLEIRRIGHNLKGVGSSFGFPDLTDLGARLENAARADDPNAMRKLIDELDAYVTRVQAGALPAPSPV